MPARIRNADLLKFEYGLNASCYLRNCWNWK